MPTAKIVKKKQFSKVVVSLVIFMNIAFTYKILEVFKVVGSEPTALVGCWFAFTTGELWMLASIKKEKVKKKGMGDE